jgi:hypothetical protein
MSTELYIALLHERIALLHRYAYWSAKAHPFAVEKLRIQLHQNAHSLSTFDPDYSTPNDAFRF